MKIISVVNRKGGVGKTTLTANLGAALALRGASVLLIDLDSQRNLTHSFYRPDAVDPDSEQRRTIKAWFDHAMGEGPPVRLVDLVAHPQRVGREVERKGGKLGILPGANVLEETASRLDAMRLTGADPVESTVRTYRMLRDGIYLGDLDSYEYILVDCRPTFDMLTRNAIVASTHILVPSRPEQFSENGISRLGKEIEELVGEYNDCVGRLSNRSVDPHLATARMLGVVFTMVEYKWQRPIGVHQSAISNIENLGVSTFGAKIRDSRTIFEEAIEKRRPVVMTDEHRNRVVQELRTLAGEVVERLERTSDG
jgi:chromosome partitioning protein